MSKRYNCEVLAPAGSWDSMVAAINAGADAVYMGGPKFGARAYAENPDDHGLLEAIDYVHLHGKRLYLTVNTLLKQRELEEELESYLRPLYEQGLDAVIVQDYGVLDFVHEHFPGMDIHVSTQMTVAGPYGAKLVESMGATRLVLPRELSLQEVRDIRAVTGIEIEAFVHGALCYCYSGQCLMSSLIGGRSGNRGRCAQPCRLPWNGSHLLNLKDMCTLDILPEILESGVYSLKIEGRMKSPRYTAGVVSMYRKYVDLLEMHAEHSTEMQASTKQQASTEQRVSTEQQASTERAMNVPVDKWTYSVDPADREFLLMLFDRGGFSEGYYRNHNGADMIYPGDKPKMRIVDENLMKELDQRYVQTKRQEKIKGILKLIPGEPATLMVTAEGLKYRNKYTSTQTPGSNSMPGAFQASPNNIAETVKIPNSEDIITVTACGPEVLTAENRPLTEEEVSKRFRKTGDTPFIFADLQIELGEGAFLPVGAMNQLRREALDELQRKIVEQYRRKTAISV